MLLLEAPGIERSQRPHYIRHALLAACAGGGKARMRKHRVDMDHIKFCDMRSQPARKRSRILESLTPLPWKENRRHALIRNELAGFHREPRSPARISCGNKSINASRSERVAHFDHSAAGPTITWSN